MPRPPTMAFPASRRPIARSTSLPRPRTEIIDAMTTIDSDSMMVWLRPAKMVGVAMGSSTLNMICDGEAPNARAASTTLGFTVRIPSDVRRISGAQREDDRDQDARDIADADEHHDGNQVDEGRDGLHRVEQRPQDSFETIALAGEDSKRQADDHGEDHRRHHDGQRRHRQ